MLSDSLYLDNIEEYVHDEDKIVSYKWLSRKLDVPVNAAKQMLHAYLLHHSPHCEGGEGGDPGLHVMYAVSGLTSGGCQLVSLVWADQLEASKEQLDVVMGVHVYSIQKTKIKDSGLLYMANYDISKQHLAEYGRWNTISCGCVSRVVAKPAAKGRGSPKKAGTAKNKTQLPTLSHVTEKEGAPNGSSIDVDESEVDTKPKVEVKRLPPSKKASGGGVRQKGKGGVASFFGKAQTKTAGDGGSKKVVPVAATASDHPPPVGNKETKTEAKQTGITIEPLVKKSPAKSSPRKRGRPPKTAKITPSQTTLLHDSDLDIDDDDSEDADRRKEEEEEEPPVKAKKTVKTSRGKKSTAKEVVLTKKRKRVQTMSSDEEEPEGEKAPPTNGGGGRRRKRVKRMVPKMHINEDGEMVTERSYEFVSTDDSAPEEPTEGGGGGGGGRGSTGAGGKSESPLKKAGTKQASLTSFFKK